MPDEKPRPYKYEIVERTFRDHKLLIPGMAVDGQAFLYECDEPQVSRALKPADEATKVATEKRAAEITEWRVKKAGGVEAERLAMREEVGALKAANAELKASIASAVAEAVAKALADQRVQGPQARRQ